MRRISAFLFLTPDGFYARPHGETDWFNSVAKDDEFEKYTHSQASSGSTLIFGRTTYEMMKSYWPTPDAIKSDPRMAKVMRDSQKIVFSKTLKSVEEGPNWKKIKLFHEIRPEEIVKMKNQEGGGMAILGSGTIVQQFANLGLIDEYALVVVPVVLGAGKYLFENVGKTNLKLLEERTFRNGLVLLRYEATKRAR